MTQPQLQRVIVVGVVAIIGLFVPAAACQDAWLSYGISIPTCPDGKLRQTARMTVHGLRRGALGNVTVAASAHYTTRDADAAQTAQVPEFSELALSLVDAKHQVTPIELHDPQPADGATRAAITLPEVPDGDYQLRATYATRLGKGELEVPLALFTPARIHVITDRPLYEPGNTVRFRAVVLRARDLGPLDGRPGMWVVKDPNGEVLLEEKAPAGDWGVVAGTFPLDKGAPTGQWKVSWVSNDATDEVAFTVEPFTLPRFRVEVAADQPFYRIGDTPTLRGAVVYSSGAPVPGATLDIQWAISGDWPPPVDWQDRLLPRHAQAGANGRFELVLPPIPGDLQGKATLTARISAIDPAGDRVEGSASVLLSQDGIAVSAVTELGDGLVQGFNNRLYLRVTTPDGREVRNAKINVKRAWQGNDNGLDALLDEDGVASLQVDPGAPVNVVIPAQPYRPAPRPALVARGEAQELIGGQGAPLVDQVELDRWLPALATCAKWFDEADPTTTVGLRVDAGGAVVQASAGLAPLDRCVVDVARGKRLPPGAERLYALTFQFTDPELSKLTASVEGALPAPEQLGAAVADLAKSTRDCLPVAADGHLPRALTWQARAGTKDVELGAWIADPNGVAAAQAAVACVTQRFASRRIKLDHEATTDSIGLIRFAVAPPAAVTAARPQATTMLGYELAVTTVLDGKPASTRLRVGPGEVPGLRLRVTPILARPGDTVTAQLIRGPSFRGALPRKLVLHHLKGKPLEAEVDPEHRTTFAIAREMEGWVEITGGGVRALVYVKPAEDLAVVMKPKRETYKPGDQAELQIQTLLGGKGGKAALGLFGVDDSLSQLAPLPGAGDLARVRPKVETSAPAFGVLDGQALTLGRIRGANAAAATVLRVSTIPSPPQLDAVVNASAGSRFDPVEELTDHFYLVLAELHAQVRGWEAKAPPGEKMRPATMSRLWQQALAACTRRGEPIVDAYGRELALSRLPGDLLALTDPRVVVVVGTRLPEDVENWAAWVAQERP